MAEPRRLQRILRVRTLQHTLTQADEARARQRVAEEEALRRRILRLAADVSPAQSTLPTAGGALGAAAHYRERLHASVAVADRRVDTADQGLTRARDARLEARRDQSAIEKLVVRAQAEAAMAELRALENAPPIRKRNRHDPC